MNDLARHFAVELIAAQIRGGAKHPSPGLIKEAVDTAKALAAALEAADAEEKIAAAPPPPAPTAGDPAKP